MCLNGHGTGVYDLSRRHVVGYRSFYVGTNWWTSRLALRPAFQRYDGNPWHSQFAFADRPPRPSNANGLHCYNSQRQLKSEQCRYNHISDMTWGKIVGTDFGVEHSNGWRLSSAIIKEVYVSPYDESSIPELLRLYPGVIFFKWDGRRYVRVRRARRKR